MTLFTAMRDELEKIAVPAAVRKAWAAERVMGPRAAKLTGPKRLQQQFKSQSKELRGAHLSHQKTIHELGGAQAMNRATQKKLLSTQKAYKKVKGIASEGKGKMSPLMAGGIGAGAGILGASMLHGGSNEQ
jgi:hypothetical protein